MEKKKKGISEQDRQRNNNFAAAFDYLRRNLGITTQGKLAKAMGVNKDTITNILNYYTPVTEDKISKLMAAFEGVFNLQYLRGESDTMLAGDVTKGSGDIVTPEVNPDPTIPEPYASIVAAKDAHIKTLQQQIDDLRAFVSYLQKGHPADDYHMSMRASDEGDMPSPRQEK